MLLDQVFNGEIYTGLPKTSFSAAGLEIFCFVCFFHSFFYYRLLYVKKNIKNWHNRCARWCNFDNVKNINGILWHCWGNLKAIYGNLKNLSLTDPPTWIQEMLVHLNKTICICSQPSAHPLSISLIESSPFQHLSPNFLQFLDSYFPQVFKFLGG